MNIYKNNFADTIFKIMPKKKNRTINLFRKLWQKTLCYKTYDLGYSFIEYMKDKAAVSDVLYGDDLKRMFKQYLNLEVDKDWIGRLYGVINPTIDINGKFDLSTTIIEIDGDNTNNNEHLKIWLYKQLDIIGRIFNMKRLYELIDMDIKHVGPIEYDNFLVVFDIVSRQLTVKALKKWIKQICNYGILGGIGYLTYMFII